MPINRQFGRDLSEKLINGAFAGAKRNIKIVQRGTFNPINETSTGIEFNGQCIQTKLTGIGYQNQNILDAEFALIVKASEVPFEVRKDNCEVSVQQLSSSNDSDLGLTDCTIVKVEKDGVDAVYKIMAKRK